MKIIARKASRYLGLFSVLLIILIAGVITFYAPCISILVAFVSFLLGQAILQNSIAKTVYQSSVLFLLIIPHILMILSGASIEVINIDIGDISPITVFLVATSCLAVQLGERETKNISGSLRAKELPVVLPLLFVFTGFCVVGWSYVWLPRNAQDPPGAVLAFVIFAAKVFPAWMAYNSLECSVEKGRGPSGLFWILILVQVAICNPYNTGRFISLSALILAFLPYLRNSVWLMLSPILVPIAALSIFPLLGQLRNDEVGLLSLREVLASLEFSTLLHTDNGIRYYWAGYQWGKELLSGILILVPRELIPFKSEGLGSVVAKNLNYGFPNVSIIPAFSGYVDFGVIGGTIIFGGLLYLMFRYIQGFGKVILICLSPILVRGDWTTFCIAFYVFLASGLLSFRLARLKLFGVRMHIAIPR